MGTNKFTEQQIKWASGHDWFVGVDDKSNNIVCVDVSVKAGDVHEKLVEFSDFESLYVWACY